MFRAALFSAAFVASLAIGNHVQTADACGTNKGAQRSAKIVRSVQSKNPSKILVVGERDSSLLKQLSGAKHKVEYVSSVKAAKHTRYDLIIADESDLEAVRTRFAGTNILKKKSTVSSTMAYAEMTLERATVARSHRVGPVNASETRIPVERGGESKARKPVESFVAISEPSKVATSSIGAPKPESATGESAAPALGEAPVDSSSQWTRSLQFGNNRVELDERAKRLLSANAAWLKQHSKASLVIEGHSDSVGNEAYNLELSERRANVARNFMVEFGIAEGRISVVAKGESEPAFVPSSSGKNRRIVLIKK